MRLLWRSTCYISKYISFLFAELSNNYFTERRCSVKNRDYKNKLQQINSKIKNDSNNLNVTNSHLKYFFNCDLRSKVKDDVNASNRKILKRWKRNINEFHYLESNDNLVRCCLANWSKMWMRGCDFLVCT